MIRVAALTLLVAALVHAQEPARAPRSTVRASGEATVTTAPDQARISIGVTTQGKTAQQAGADNAQKADAVITQLRGLLGANADVKTVNYSVNPEYNYGDGKSPKITGYTANNTVEVRIDNLKDVGKVIDAVTQTGANTISGIQFTLKDDRAVRSAALRAAATQAKANAEAIAAAMGLRVIGVVSAEAGEPAMPRPMFAMGAAQMRAAVTPVEAGTLDIHAAVTVTLEVTQ